MEWKSEYDNECVAVEKMKKRRWEEAITKDEWSVVQNDTTTMLTRESQEE